MFETVTPQISQLGEPNSESLREDQAIVAKVGGSQAPQVESSIAKPLPLGEEAVEGHPAVVIALETQSEKLFTRLARAAFQVVRPFIDVAIAAFKSQEAQENRLAH